MSNHTCEPRLVLRTAIWLTIVLIAAQVLLAAVHSHVSGMDTAFLKNNTMGSVVSFFMPQQFYLIYPAIKYIFLQIFIYALYAFLLGLITVSIKPSRALLYLVWFISVVMIVSGNLYYVPHSLFSSYLQLLSHEVSRYVFFSSLLLLSGLVLLAFIRSIHKMRWLVTAVFISSAYIYSSFMVAHPVISHASSDKPNVIIIGFDSLRPDFLTYFNPRHQPTPAFDHFLQNATVFKNVYTP